MIRIACFLLTFILSILSANTSFAAKKNKDKDTEKTKPDVVNIQRQKLLNSLQRAQQQDTNLAKELATNLRMGDSIEWLEGHQAEKFLSIFRQSQTKQSLGTIILIPDTGQHADWPGLIQKLRIHLSDTGFSTLSFSVPDYQPLADPMLTMRSSDNPNPRNNKKEKEDKKEKDDKKSKAKHKEKQETTPPSADTTANIKQPLIDPKLEWETVLSKRIQAALQLSKSKSTGMKYLLISGRSASLINKLSATKKIDVNGFIFINQPMSRNNDATIRTLLPTLEIITANRYDQEALASLAKDRKNRAALINHPNYRVIQSLTNDANLGSNLNWISNRIRGWLQSTQSN